MEPLGKCYILRDNSCDRGSELLFNQRNIFPPGDSLRQINMCGDDLLVVNSEYLQRIE